MPEGDTVWRLARRLDAALAGRVLAGGELRVARYATSRFETVTVIGHDTVGKHLLTRFDDGRTLHTHLRMDGSWSVLADGKRLPRRVHPTVRIVLEAVGGPTVYGVAIPVVELLRTRDEPHVVGHLGPDPLRADWDLDEAARRIERSAGRPLVAVLLDQRVIAGLGNLWANELAFLLGTSPWTPVAHLDARAVASVAARALSASAHGLLQVTTGDPRRGHEHFVAGRAHQPCRRCGTPVRVRAETTGDPQQRRTWWCPTCQPSADRVAH